MRLCPLFCQRLYADETWYVAGLNLGESLSAGGVKRYSSKQVEVIDVNSLRPDI